MCGVPFVKQQARAHAGLAKRSTCFRVSAPCSELGDCEKNSGVGEYGRAQDIEKCSGSPMAWTCRYAAASVCGENDERRCIQVKWCVALLHTTPHLYRSPSGPERTRSLRRGGRAARNDTEPAAEGMAKCNEPHRRRQGETRIVGVDPRRRPTEPSR